MSITRYLRKLNYIKHVLSTKATVSYSQVGEDKIIKYLFDSLKIFKIHYLDIGANHPINGSNTYLFYTLGNNGVCIEPNPTLASQIRNKRSRDICIEKGIGLGNLTNAEYYIYDNDGLNTFSKNEVEIRNRAGINYLQKVNLPLININEVLKSKFTNEPDLLSIDVEGLDIEILKEYDFVKYAPKVIVVETVKLNNTPKDGKIDEILDLILSKGYLQYADTFINTIFCRKDLF